jgi:hypothetical protein
MYPANRARKSFKQILAEAARECACVRLTAAASVRQFYFLLFTSIISNLFGCILAAGEQTAAMPGKNNR